jgi:hypothetical protein
MGNPVVRFEAIGRDAQVWGRSSPLLKFPALLHANSKHEAGL